MGSDLPYLMPDEELVARELAAEATARANGGAPRPKPKGGETRGVSLDDFYAYMPMHSYIFAPTGEMWPARSVNSRIPPIADGGAKPVQASNWLDRNRPVEQMTWAPGLPTVISDRLIADGGWIERKGVRCFNLYRPPTSGYGNAGDAGIWLDHVRNVFGDAAGHIIDWLAQRIQRPEEKVNHALVLGGGQGVGKDTLLEPVKRAVGPWNFAEVSPKHMLGRFNGFARSVILRVSEARDLGDVDRFAFYDHMKTYTAAPPDVLRVDEKNFREYCVLNCCGVILTTNHKADGIYLPPDDRRHFVAWSDLTRDDFGADYWSRLWDWYESGGYAHVATYLAGLDLTSFDPKAPPPKTPAFWDVVDASRAPEDAELADVLDRLNNPAAVTIERVAIEAGPELGMWMRDRRSRRQVPHRMEACGYVPVRNDHAKDGLWKLGDRRQAIYAKKTMLIRDRVAAATDMAGQ
jgi:Family of unknown function (DUF5906)